MKQPKAQHAQAAAHAGRSPAQVRAGKAFAAGGRKAQAKARAAGKKPSAAQLQAALKWAAAGRAAQKARRTGKVPAKKAAAVAPAQLRQLPGWTWIMGCNDTAPTCAAAAVANHLLASTGLEMTPGEVALLHGLAGGDDGAAIASVLEAFRAHGHLFCNGKVRLVTFSRTDEDVIVTGLVVGLAGPHARHAVLSHPAGMVSWGRVLPWTGQPDEAWTLEWLGA